MVFKLIVLEIRKNWTQTVIQIALSTAKIIKRKKM